MQQAGFFPISMPTPHISSLPPTAGRHFGPPDFPCSDAVAGTPAAAALSICPGLPGPESAFTPARRGGRIIIASGNGPSGTDGDNPSVSGRGAGPGRMRRLGLRPMPVEGQMPGRIGAAANRGAGRADGRLIKIRTGCHCGAGRRDNTGAGRCGAASCHGSRIARARTNRHRTRREPINPAPGSIGRTTGPAVPASGDP